MAGNRMSNIAGSIKAAVKSAARKLAAKKSGKSDIRNWTDEEIYAGMDRTSANETRALNAYDDVEPRPLGYVFTKEARTPGQDARLKDQSEAASDSADVVFSERRRRENARKGRRIMGSVLRRMSE